MRLLVLTDHLTHAPGESIYPLLHAMAELRPNAAIAVATRSLDANRGFFVPGDVRTLRTRPLDEHFSFTADGRWFRTAGLEVADIGDAFDAVFLRLDRERIDGRHVSPEPFLRSLAQRFSRVIMMNDPVSIVETGSKRFLVNFRDLCPPMRLCSSIDEIMDFAADREIVVKPIHGYGGKGILRLDADRVMRENAPIPWDEARAEIGRQLRDNGEMLAVEFMRHVDQGDKRIVVVDGRIMGAALRIPAKGDWRGNLSSGATSEPAYPDPDEIAIAARVSSVLTSRGIAIFGFDTLVGNDGRRVLSEINTLNVGGLAQSQSASGPDVVRTAADALWEHLEGRQSRAG